VGFGGSRDAADGLACGADVLAASSLRSITMNSEDRTFRGRFALRSIQPGSSSSLEHAVRCRLVSGKRCCLHGGPCTCTLWMGELLLNFERDGLSPEHSPHGPIVCDTSEELKLQTERHRLEFRRVFQALTRGWQWGSWRRGTPGWWFLTLPYTWVHPPSPHLTVCREEELKS